MAYRHVLAILLGCVLLSACGAAPAPAPPSKSAHAAGTVPRPAHVVIVVEENHSFDDVIGSGDAPYLASLVAQGALFTQSFALTHPSQPNYLALFSGSTQGVSDDSCPHTFDADNLGHQLRAAGLSFTGFSEGLPGVGSTECFPGEYDRDHNPWVDFTDLPSSTNQPLRAFPANYDSLPTVSFVMPDLDHDMHNGTVAQADSWLKANLDGYVRWATTHDSLLIVTGDEDDGSAANQIATMFVGAQVEPGRYGDRIDHYTVLRTIEAAYGLPPLGAARNVQPITGVWRAA